MAPPRDDRHHRPSRSRSPISPEWMRETPAEREERRLAEAAVLVGPPPPAQVPEPAEATAPAAQAASPAAPPREGAPDAQEAENAAPESHATAPTAAPGTPPTRGVAPAQEPGASPELPQPQSRAGRVREGLQPRPRQAAPPPRPATPRPPARRKSGGTTPHGPRAPRRRPMQQLQWAGRARSTAPTPTPPTPTPVPPSRSPPSPSPRGGRGTSAPRRPSARRRASCCRSCKDSGTPGA